MTNTLENHMRKMLLTALVQRQIFCPITGKVLDVRTCGYLVDAEGDPAYVCDMSAYMAIADTKEIRDSLAAKGLHIPAELSVPGVTLRSESLRD